jgi:hypothetical protein
VTGPRARPRQRQKVLVLYLANSSLSSKVVAWALYDGTGDESAETGDHPDAPYESGLDALRAGWRLFQASPLVPAAPGAEYSTSYQKFEFLFEMIDERGGGDGAGD